MKNLENINLGERFRLSPKGYWSDNKKQVWINEGRRLDNDKPVVVYLFHPQLNDQSVEQTVAAVEKNKMLTKIYEGAQKINNQTIPYAAFENTPQTDIKIDERKDLKEKTGKSGGTGIPVWLFVLVLAIAILLLVILAIAVGIPIIQGLIQTPTP
jgi:hypothetical protein